MHRQQKTFVPFPAMSGIGVKRSLCSGCALALLMTLTAPARAADFFADNEARRAILDLRQRYLALSEENTQIRELLQATQTQMDALRAELLTRLREQDERCRHALGDWQKNMDTTRAEGSTMTENTLATGLTTAPPARTEETDQEKSAFNTALNKFRASDYAGAQATLRTFLQQYPQSSRRIAALYWLGNAEYALRNYSSAMGHYRTVITQAPDHERTPEALLALSACQIEMQDTAGARATLEKLITSYPRSEAAQAAQDRLARLR